MSDSFTQSWIQALTKAADSPFARQAKPQIELVNRLVRNSDPDDRKQAAEALWQYANEFFLGDVIRILPVCQPKWHFDSEDELLFELADAVAIDGFERWTQGLGLSNGSFQLVSEVAFVDWARILREEAVRNQRALDAKLLATQTTQHLPCTAKWEDSEWTISFDAAEWVQLKQADPVRVSRPAESDYYDLLVEAVQSAEAKLGGSGNAQLEGSVAWQDCVPELAGLHDKVLSKGTLAPLTKQVWRAVWPAVYREQNVLAGKANLSEIRDLMAASLKVAPQLTLWMFLFARLSVELAQGYGLGSCADFGLPQ